MRRLRFESLECRQMLAITVNTFVDERDFNISGGDDVSLRDAILEAPTGETINFAPSLNGATITLTLGQEIAFAKSLTIDASMLSNGITIDADDPDDHLPPEEQERGNGIRIFHITDPISGPDAPLVTLIGLTLTGGDPSSSNQNGNGGAIRSEGRLEIIDCTIEENDAYSGGGIHIDVADGNTSTQRQVLTIENSVIQNNTALAGGGIDIGSDVNTTPTDDFYSITNTRILINHAISTNFDVGGGGILALLHGAHLTVTDSTISGNTSAASGFLIEGYSGGSGGGGIYARLDSAASLAVIGTEVSDNHATFGNGGGILAKAFDNVPNPYQAITITRSTISDNTASDRGGGLFTFIREAAEVLIQESRVTGNDVTPITANSYGNGGGIYAFFWNGDVNANLKPKLTMTGSTIDNNTTSQKGGGVFVGSRFNGNFIATNSTISGNRTTDAGNGAGGGMFIVHSQYSSDSVDAWLRNLTITQNVSASGGGVETLDFDNVRVRIGNSIISENYNKEDELTRVASNLKGRVDTSEFHHNFIGTGSAVKDLGGNDISQSTWDDVNIVSDTPLLGDLQNNGGPTPTHALLAESPAIDAGSNDLATIPLSGTPEIALTTDQRGAGFPRVFDHPGVIGGAGPVDIGALEEGLCVSTTTDDFDGNLSFGDLSLREAVDYANVAGQAVVICVPADHYYLTRNGAESTTNANTDYNDLDILGDVTIVGAGPGLTVIDADQLTSHNRIFDVAAGGVLNLSGVTLQLGDTTSGSQANGGGIRVQDSGPNGGELNLRYSAIVGNDTGHSGTGGAIYFAPSATGSIESSVITLNTADEQTGGIYLEAGGGEVTIKSTIVANNNVGETDPDIYAGSSGRLVSLGYNRFTSYGGFTLHSTDYVGSVDYVVTSVADTYNNNVSLLNLSLREAIGMANSTSGTQTIWLPAWVFRLTLDGGAPDVSSGDLDVTDALTIRGIERLTTVDATAISDAAFDVMGAVLTMDENEVTVID